jgi:hypothetical protein
MPTKPTGRRTLSEADTKAIAAMIAEELRPILKPTPLHEMSMDELRDEMNEAAGRFQANRTTGPGSGTANRK